MSDDSFDASAKGRTTESGAALARGRGRYGGGGHGVVAHVWLVATASISLPRTGARRRACAVGRRELGHDHGQNAGEPRARSARSCDRVEFARAGVETLFVRAPRGSTPEDELLVQFQGMIAEYERAQIFWNARDAANDIAPAKEKLAC